MRQPTKSTKPIKLERVRCCDCEYSYDPHELDYKGEPFLCHCKAKGEWGAKFSVFLFKPQNCTTYHRKQMPKYTAT